MLRKKWFALFFVFILLMLSVSFVLAQGTTTGTGSGTATVTSSVDSEAEAQEFLDGVKRVVKFPILKQIFGIFFGVWNVDSINIPGLETFLIGDNNNNAAKVASLIIYFIVWFIFLFVYKDMFELFSPFSESVVWLISLGLVVVSAQLKWIILFSGWLLGLIATVGFISVWLELIVLMVILITASFGSQWASNFSSKIALNRKIAREAGNVAKGAAETKQAIEALRETRKGFD